MFKPEKANISKSPRFMFMPVKSGLKGMGRKQTTTGATETSGASQNSNRSAPSGATSCLLISLPASAKGCSRPCGPTS